MQANTSSKLRVAELPIASVVANPGQPRKDFDGIEELARSIEENGLLQPITVRPIGDTFEIVAGERRFRAMSLLGWKKVPCIVRDLEDAPAYILSVMENVARREMNPIEEAFAIQQLLDSGMDAPTIERKIGIGSGNGGEVTFKVSILKCIEPVQHLLRRGNFNMKSATQLARLSPDGQMKAMREFQAAPMTPTQFTGMVNTIWALENQLDMFPETKVDAATVEAGKTFKDNLDKLARAAAKLDGLDNAKLAEALAHDPSLVALLDGTIKVLQRAKLAIAHSEGRKVALKAGAA